MPRGRRKIGGPTDSQPQFELGDTAEDIEREERERQEQEERDRERMERERTERTEHMEETEERTEKRPGTDTDTDVESTQSRQKKGQMKSIFLSDSDEDAIVEFIKQNAELYKTHTKFRQQRREISSFQEFIYQHCQEVVRDSMYQIWQAHSHEVRTSCSEEH